jgi:hypothetical protein
MVIRYNLVPVNNYRYRSALTGKPEIKPEIEINLYPDSEKVLEYR